MRLRAALLTLTAAASAAALAAPTEAPAAPSQSQQVFTRSLLDDPGTSAGIKRLLTKKIGIVDPRSGFLDVTGDGRQDALVLVTTNGAAGTVALYVFSTHGQPAGGSDTKLKVLFRLQSLYRATLRINGTALSVLEPVWAAGDDLCCPAKLRERDYRFDAKALTFRRTADHVVPFTR
ncbi:hypothetical protein FSW04_11650 [Baekduia soli]|uniref:VCBS repeat-containing protein n=1 Tax=Baekduia soli TaxID=496014 RepID=A0A5B8U594_9ACTN|nr:hypothetical protein [Baekduia soli]QEC48157.1 hypothetical protein FSW04_11650 [Baekduia soli]